MYMTTLDIAPFRTFSNVIEAFAPFFQVPWVLPWIWKERERVTVVSKLWSWRRSSTRVSTSTDVGGWRSPGSFVSPSGRSRSGSRTAEWSGRNRRRSLSERLTSVILERRQGTKSLDDRPYRALHKGERKSTRMSAMANFMAFVIGNEHVTRRWRQKTGAERKQ